jgi:hypothetical protein
MGRWGVPGREGTGLFLSLAWSVIVQNGQHERIAPDQHILLDDCVREFPRRFDVAVEVVQLIALAADAGIPGAACGSVKKGSGVTGYSFNAPLRLLIVPNRKDCCFARYEVGRARIFEA